MVLCKRLHQGNRIVKEKTTIYTIAEMAGVSIATVSRIVNNTFRGKEEVRRTVLDAIRRTNYQPKREARGLMGKKTSSRMIGVMAPFFIHPFFVEVLKGCYQAIHEHQYSIVLYDVDTRRMKKQLFERIMEENFLDGLLLVNMHLNEQEYRRITDRMPLTLVAAQTDFAESVVVDHYKGICMGVDYLNELGHRIVAFINNEKEIFESVIRERAFRERAEKLGIQYKVDYRSVDRRSGYLAARSILENNSDVTCLFYYSDLMAYGGLDYINERQLQSKVSIIGFDGFEMTFQVSLTTIAQPMQRMGELGANMLIEKIENPDAEDKSIVLDPWLDKGKTCGAVSHEQ